MKIVTKKSLILLSLSIFLLSSIYTISAQQTCSNTKSNCGNFLICQNLYTLDGCNSGYYRTYYCSNNVPLYSQTCTSYCCSLIGGKCTSGTVCSANPPTTTTTTTTPTTTTTTTTTTSSTTTTTSTQTTTTTTTTPTTTTTTTTTTTLPPSPPTGMQIIDDNDTRYSDTGWKIAPPNGPAQGYNNSVHWKNRNGTGYATWSPNFSGRYYVFVSWTIDSNRPTDAKYTVYHLGGQNNFTIDQTKNSTDGSSSIQFPYWSGWKYIGAFNFASGNITLWDETNDGKVLIADAVKFAQSPVKVPTDFPTIQAAIDAVSPGETIIVENGTFDGFTISGKSNLTIVGSGKNSTTVKPTSLIDTGIGHRWASDMQVAVLVNNANNITLKDMTIDGNTLPNYDAVLFWNQASGTLENLVIRADSVFISMSGHGLAVDATSPSSSTLVVKNCDFPKWNRNAIDAVNGNGGSTNGGDIFLNITGGTFTGRNDNSTNLQNGINYWNVARGTVGGIINGVTISNLAWNDGTWTSFAIAGPDSDSLNVSNSIFTNTVGYIGAGYGSIDATNNNTFDGVNPSTGNFTIPQLGIIEDKIWDKLDDNSYGLVSILPHVTIATTSGRGIQAAIDAVSGSTVYVAPGTYDEQVVINKNLTLQGAGDSTIIQPSNPSTLTSFYTYPVGTPYMAGKKVASIILVHDTGNGDVTIKDLKIDGINVTSLPVGADILAGVLYAESAGKIQNLTINNINTTGYADRTYGIDMNAIGQAVSVEVSNNRINNFARNGINANGGSLTVNIHDNTVTGPSVPVGPTQVPNGIVLWKDLGGAVNNNIVNSLHFINPTTSYRSTGIMGFGTLQPGVVIQNNEVYDVDDAINPSSGTIIRSNSLHNNGNGLVLEMGAFNNQVIGNNITNNTNGVQINGALNSNPQGVDPPGTGNSVNYNLIYNNTAGIVSFDNTQTFDAENNWWGNCSGPYHLTLNPTGTGNSASDYVDFITWLCNPSEVTSPPKVISVVLAPSVNNTYVKAGNISFTINFDKLMNTAVPLNVTFGQLSPYLQNLVTGNWLNLTSWKGYYLVMGTQQIIDDGDPNYVDTSWTSASGQGYNNDVRYVAAGSGLNNATWKPVITTDGNYKVYVSWTTYSNRATNAKYTVFYYGGNQTFVVNQKLLANQSTTGGVGQWSGWYYLGTFNFRTNSTNMVVLKDNANNYVIADAVKFESSTSLPGDGTYRLRIADGKDFLNNVMNTNTSFTFYIDTQNPAVKNQRAPNISYVQNQTITVQAYDLGSGIANVVVQVGSANYTMQPIYNDLMVTGYLKFASVWTYYTIISNTSLSVGTNNYRFFVTDNSGNVNDTVSGSFFVNGTAAVTYGKIAYLCRDGTCNYGIEQSVIQWLNSRHWVVTAKRYDLWTTSQLNGMNLIVCSDETFACNPTANVTQAHKVSGKGFVEISNRPQANAGDQFDYTSDNSGNTNPGETDLYITVGDSITAGYIGNFTIYSDTSKGIGTVRDEDLWQAFKVADVGNTYGGYDSSLFKVEKNGTQGRYAWIGWFYNYSSTGWTPQNMNSQGQMLLERAVNWVQCGNAMGCFECLPAQTQSQSCGNCGTESRTCSSGGSWGSWGTCSGQGCAPGSTQSCTGGIKTCSPTCTWGSCVITTTTTTTSSSTTSTTTTTTSPSCRPNGQSCSSDIQCCSGNCEWSWSQFRFRCVS